MHKYNGSFACEVTHQKLLLNMRVSLDESIFLSYYIPSIGLQSLKRWMKSTLNNMHDKRNDNNCSIHEIWSRGRNLEFPLDTK